MADLNKMGKELYSEDFPNRSLIGKSLGKVAGYFTKPSTHGGFYVSGIGCMLGGLGGLIREIGISAYSDYPDIVSNITSGSWYEATCKIGASVTKVALNSAYIAGAGGMIGYIGGTIVTGRIVDSLHSIFRFGKNKEVKR